jgi:hypothetical protein
MGMPSRRDEIPERVLIGERTLTSPQRQAQRTRFQAGKVSAMSMLRSDAASGRDPDERH